MPEFTDPIFLWLLPLPVLLFVWLARRRRPALRFPDLRLFDGLPKGRAALAKWFAPSWRSLTALLIVLALAGPRWPDPGSAYRLPSEGIAISLVLDASGSMGSQDVQWRPGELPVSRFEAAKRALTLFLAGGTGPDGAEFPGRPNDRAGLVTFADWPDPVTPLTLSHSVLLQMLEAQQVAGDLDQGTNVGDAIAQGVLQLEAAGDQRKVLVLFSDGETNFDLEEPRKPLKPRQAAQLAAARDITVYAIDTGGNPVEPADPSDSQAREAFERRAAGREILKSVAEMTGGLMFPANDAEALRLALRRVDELERRDVLSFRYRRYHEMRPWLGFAALGLVLLGWLVERTAWRKLP